MLGLYPQKKKAAKSLLVGRTPPAYAAFDKRPDSALKHIWPKQGSPIR
jgi:hypothetical protein